MNPHECCITLHPGFEQTWKTWKNDFSRIPRGWVQRKKVGAKKYSFPTIFGKSLHFYAGVEDVFSDYFPGVGVGSMRFGWGEPAVCNEDLCGVDCVHPSFEGAVDADLADGNGVSTPARQPRQEFLCGRGLWWLLDPWCRLIRE